MRRNSVMVIDFNLNFLDITERLEDSWPEPTIAGLVFYISLNYYPSCSELRQRSAHQKSQLIFLVILTCINPGVTTISWRWDTSCEGSTNAIAEFIPIGLRSSSWRRFTVGRTWCSVGTVATLSSRDVIQFDVWNFCVLHNDLLSSDCFSTMSIKFPMYFFHLHLSYPIFLCIFYSKYLYQLNQSICSSILYDTPNFTRIQKNLNIFTFWEKYEELWSNWIKDAKNVIW